MTAPHVLELHLSACVSASSLWEHSVTVPVRVSRVTFSSFIRHKHQGFWLAPADAGRWHVSTRSEALQLCHVCPLLNVIHAGSVLKWWCVTCAELARCQLDLAELTRLIQKLHWDAGGLPITNTELEHRISMQASLLVQHRPQKTFTVITHDDDDDDVLIWQNLSLEKPKKKSGKIWGHSRTLSRVESLGVVSVKTSCWLVSCFRSCDRLHKAS